MTRWNKNKKQHLTIPKPRATVSCPTPENLMWFVTYCNTLNMRYKITITTILIFTYETFIFLSRVYINCLGILFSTGYNIILWHYIITARSKLLFPLQQEFGLKYGLTSIIRLQVKILFVGFVNLEHV